MRLLNWGNDLGVGLKSFSEFFHTTEKFKKVLSISPVRNDISANYYRGDISVKMRHQCE